MKKTAIILAAIITTLSLSQDPAEISRLNRRISELEAQVRTLQDDLAHCRALARHQAVPADGLATMILEAVVPKDAKAELSALKRRIDELNRLITSKERSGDTRDADARKKLTEWRRELRVLNNQRTRIVEHPRYWLLGWDGLRDIQLFVRTLTTEEARELVIGNAIAYKGKEVDTYFGHERDRDYSTIVTERVRVTQFPLTWAPRSRDPIWKAITGVRTPQTPPNLRH